MKAIVVPRAQVPRRAWNEFVRLHDEGWFTHTSAWMDYALAYTPGARDHCEAVLTDDTGTMLALLPALRNVQQEPCYGGQMAAAPLVAPASGLDVKVCGHPKLQVVFRPGREPLELPGDGFVERQRWTYVVNLWDDEKARWGRLRRSYRGLVRTMEKRFDVSVHSLCGAEEAWRLMEQALALHTAAAGRQTRSEETWRIQADWLVAGYAVLAIAHHAGTPVGFAYALRYKDWAYYFSGASAEAGLQHLLQWRLMDMLAKDGATQYYELGHDALPGADEKARNIAFFKSGFGGTLVPVTVMEAA